MNYYYSTIIKQQIIDILKKHASIFIDIEDATFEEDTQHATDMKIKIKSMNAYL